MQLVTFRGGFVAAWSVVQRLLELERRGARFELLAEGRFRVVPPDLLTADDVRFLRGHRDEARQAIRHQADDSTLFVS